MEENRMYKTLLACGFAAAMFVGCSGGDEKKADDKKPAAAAPAKPATAPAAATPAAK